jgi:hypothetical protein
MGGRAGGGAGGFGSRSLSAGATEQGYSMEMAAGVLSAESGIKGNDYETLYAFNKDGKVVYQAKGDSNSVYYDRFEVENKVVTHNHPKGSAFSAQDITGMVRNNMKEMRITSKEYTYSIKRPQRGWRKSVEAVAKKAAEMHISVQKSYQSQKTGNASSDRKLFQKLTTDASRQLAKDFGWDFTVKKNR